MKPALLLSIHVCLLFPITALAQWQLDGAPVSTTVYTQSKPAIVPDGAGGAIVAWNDFRNGVWDIYVQRVNASGVAQWAANGVEIGGNFEEQSNPMIAADGAGGAIVTWQSVPFGVSPDILAQKISAAGTTQWTPGGVGVCIHGADQRDPRIVSDGAGGAIVAWRDFRNGNWDIYAQGLNAAGVNQFGPTGLGVCVDPSQQSSPRMAPDDAGGAIIAWHDNRSGADDVYVQRVVFATLRWTINGLALCNATNNQNSPELVSDGVGGAIVTWQDFRNGTNWDIYSQRVTSLGAPQWATNGVALCTAVSDQVLPMATSDGAKGAVVAWKDNRNAASDIYSQRVNALGATQWSGNGMPLSTAANNQSSPAMTSDGAGGAIAAWEDDRSTTTDLYVQRVEGRYGYWGKPEPALFAVKDVPADQGGKVRLEFYASQRDQLNQQVISHYTIWRAIDQAAFALASAAGATEVKLSDPASKFTGKAIRHDKAQMVDYFWELIGQQDAIYRYAYSFNASTSFDSTAANAATHRFQVVAHSFSQFVNWPSNILSGRSVDNVAPPAPLFLTAQRIDNYVYLKWNGVHVPDLNKYTVYRATATGVTPVPPNFLADENDTLLTDSSAPTSALYYIVTANDVHQNQSAKSNEASVAPVTNAGNLPPVTALTMRQNHPNPFTGETTLEVGLASASDVSVEVYDVAGRRVLEHSFQRQTKGWSTLRLESRDRNGALLPSGVYFYRVRAGSETVTNKMVITR